ncbi:TPA: hypothetical protein MI760_28550 [Klebsiella pneumoniae]|nr:hypothetical protein [Klebsiella pneumoniae]
MAFCFLSVPCNRPRGGGLAGRGGGLSLRSVPQFPAICPRCPVESGEVAFHALTGIKLGKYNQYLY